MGPLMSPEHPLCLRKQKSATGWSKYVKGASAVFAWHISRCERVTILSPPPPERFHPSGRTNFRVIEEPILKKAMEGGAMVRINMAHPMADGAEDFIYQMWPVDETDTWVESFGTMAPRERCWRSVKRIPENGSNKAQDSESGARMLLLEEQLKESKALRKIARLKKKARKEKAALKKVTAQQKKMKAMRKEQAALKKEKKALKQKAR